MIGEDEYLKILRSNDFQKSKQNVVIKQKLTCKETLRQMFIRVYRLEI